MGLRLLKLVGALALVVVGEHPALAGMGSPTLSDVRRVLSLSNLTRQRLEVISFFLMGFLACGWAVKAVWNSVRTDFPSLPRLTYGRATGLVGLWGLLFVLVLTMISGARELMTPGAWEKKGIMYQLIQEPETPPGVRWDGERSVRLGRLGEALREYAGSRGGVFPTESSIHEIPAELWRASDSPEVRFVYVHGRTMREAPLPLAYEPDQFGRYRFVLLTNGVIQLMSADEIRKLLEARTP